MFASISRFSMRRLAGALILMTLTAGVASAGPNALYYAGVDDSWGRTLEDDQAVVNAPLTPLHGITNRVVESGTTQGDGGRFLDARVAQRIGDTSIFAGQLADTATSRPNVIFPGAVHAVAWYGAWSDINDDGVIDDIQDSADAPGDEFVWRGRSSSADVPMDLYVHPLINGSVYAGFGSTSVNALRLYGLGEGHRYYSETYLDRTDTDEQHYFQSGSSTWAVTPGMEDSFLAPMTHVTVADAIQVQGGELRRDPNDPNARVDVDRYQSLSPDAELLYISTMTALKPTIWDTRWIVRQFGDMNFALVNGAIEDANRAIGRPNEVAFLLTSPQFPREPNHARDDFNGNAIFGGVGDIAGSYNTYEGYQSGYHFIADSQVKFYLRPAVDVNTGPGGVQVHQGASVFFVLETVSPGVSLTERPHERRAHALFSAGATLSAWWDKSGDGFRGSVCDPSDPAEWDAERNTCREYDQYSSRHEFNGGGGDGGAGLCLNSAKQDLIVTPVGGNWPGVVVIKDYEYYSNALWGSTPEVRVDDQPIILEWNPCSGNSGTSTRDMILFPGGSPTIAVETSFTATSGIWIDSDGVYHAPETVTDVDIYYPVL